MEDQNKQQDVTFLSNTLQHIDTSAYQQGME